MTHLIEKTALKKYKFLHGSYLYCSQILWNSYTDLETYKMSSKVVLLFGYGPRIGAAVAKAFASRGYQVAVVSRSDKAADTTNDYLSIKADLSNAFAVEDVFASVRDKLGIPSVVVYNGKEILHPQEQTNINWGGISSIAFILSTQGFDEPLSNIIADAHVNTFSAYAAAQLAVKGFAELSSDASKTFIYTGNKSHIMTLEPLLSFGMGKAATAHMIHYLAEAYKPSGYKYAYTLARRWHDADSDMYHTDSIM